jgi:hypothetical protein
MELIKEEIRLVITALTKFKEESDCVNVALAQDTKVLIYKFENYLNQGEN